MVWCKQYFDTLNRLGMDHKCDRWTDTLMANAMLKYVAWPKQVRKILTSCSKLSLNVQKCTFKRNLGLNIYNHVLLSCIVKANPKNRYFSSPYDTYNHFTAEKVAEALASLMLWLPCHCLWTSVFLPIAQATTK